MNSPIDNPDPLNEQEQSLARVLRALPTAEPPPALDARILRAASDAVASARPRRRAAWLASGGALWGIGSAAAAVLVIGIAWQRMNPPTPAFPATSPAAVPADTRDDGRLQVEFQTREPRQFDNSPPPPAPKVVAAPAAKAAPPRQEASKPAPTAAARPATDYPFSRIGENVPQHENEVGTAAAAPARSEPAPSGSLRDESPQGVRADAALGPSAWLARIRLQSKRGDVEGARASLRRFVATYPDQPVPDDLRFLLKE